MMHVNKQHYITGVDTITGRQHKYRCLGCALLALFAFVVPRQCAAESVVGRISLLVGTATIAKARGDGPRRLRVNSVVRSLDTIATNAESRCEIACNNGMVVRVDENTAFVVRGGAVGVEGDKPDGVEQLKLVIGSVWVNARKLTGARRFDLHTPTATAAIRGTAYNIDCNLNSSDIMVFDGVVQVQPVDSAAGDSTYSLTKGRQVTIVRNLDEYIEQERKAFDEFRQAEMEEYEKFLQQEQEEYADFAAQMDRELANLRKSFKTVGGVHVAERGFAPDSTSESDWIQWNRERDR